MAEHCKDCGLELFTAQRFCRSCGAPTEQLSEEQVPTRMMPPPPGGLGRAQWRQHRADLETRDQPGLRSPGWLSADACRRRTPRRFLRMPLPSKRSPVGWILAFIGMGLFVLVVVAVMMMARFGRARFETGGPSGPAASRKARREIA